MEIRWLGNSCVEILEDRHLVIDPNFKIEPEEDVDLVLVTHEHADHFDMDCYNQIKAPIIAPRATLLEHELTGVEARPGEDYNGIKILESFCWKSKESVSYLTYGILHCGDSSKLPELRDVRVIFTACFPDSYDEYIEGFKRLKPEIVIPIHFSKEKKDDAIGLGKKVKEAGMDFKLLEVGETLNI